MDMIYDVMEAIENHHQVFLLTIDDDGYCGCFTNNFDIGTGQRTANVFWQIGTPT
jgi:hypothetical protein